MKEVKFLCVPFDPETGVFDDEAVQMYLRGRDIVRSEPQFFEHDGRGYWSLYLETRQLRGGEIRGGAPSVPDTKKNLDSAEERAFRALLRELDEVERGRYQVLTDWRRGVARAEGVPPFVVLTNRQCLDIARTVPRSLGGLAEIHGVGKKRMAKHGRQILEVLHGREAAASAGPGAAAIRAVDGHDQVADGTDAAVPQAAAQQSVDADR